MSYKHWRLTHRYAFSHWKWLMVITSVILIIISITGIILIHEHDTTFFSETRVSTSILPGRYQEKLDNMRAAQGVADQFAEDGDSVPLSWIVYDLHSGEFFGSWAWLYYDILSLALVLYSITGIYMFFSLMNGKKKSKPKEKK